MRVAPLLMVILWMFFGVAALCAADTDPGATYYRVYTAYKQGEDFERAGQLDDALQKFRFCVSVLEQMQQNSPDYQPSLVEFRLKKSRASIARVQSMQAPLAGAEALDRPPPSVPAAPASVFAPPAVPYRVNVPGRTAQAIAPRESSGAFSDDVVINALKEQIRSLEFQRDQLSRVNSDLSDQILQYKGQVVSAQKEVDLWRVQVVELKGQLSQSRQSNDDLQQAIDHLSRERAFDERRIAGLESDLSNARADLEVADEQNTELFSKLDSAAKYIAKSDEIRSGLLEERKTLAAKAGDNSAALAKAQKERDAAVAERDALRKKVDDASAMAKENKVLASKLAAAEKALATATQGDSDRSKVEQGLRNELDAVNKKLSAMRDQLKTGQDRIAELEKQLSDTANATALATGAIADENALLKSIVVRELQEQARRQQARKLVEEELEKLQVRSSTLLENMSALAAAEPRLSPAEKKMVGGPAVQLGVPSDFTVVKPLPESSDLPPELAARAEEANQLSQQRKFDEARAIYQEIAKKAPQSYLAAVNLGIAQRQLGDYENAATAFQRALELRSGDPFALTNLGTAEYRAGNLTRAVKVLQEAVAADADSYLAHYFLGMALSDQGDRAGARREIQKSLAIKPDYVPAIELSRDLEGAFDGGDEKKAPASPAP